MTQEKIIMYGADWCGDCRRAKKFLDEGNIPYAWINTDENKDAEDFVRRVNNGKRIIPTIVFEDGSMLVEPSNEELADKLGAVV
ncbi:MAG: thioredoxin family protein [Anaerolineales bacterium]|jgi:glutaredoxin-like protein|nr:thioredoxin family protein [Anaerolineales bacterium]MCC6987176.1 thioredoxin family protein [Anaerolineales bacterium]